MTQHISLDDKYTAQEGSVYVSGSQALVRLPLMQRARDVAAGLNTAGFISGYRGSPLGIYDLALWQAQKHLKANHIVFQPGVNEDLAATAVWGTQQVGLIDESRYDGVFAMWYGKGPGVDRSGDPLKHGSYGGTAANGGVLVLCGDDHAARSSTVAHQSEHALIHFGMPVFNPAHVQDYLDLGIMGFALSRYAGAWIGFKCVTDTVESSASVLVDPARVVIRTPDDYVMPPSGLNMQLGTWPIAAETRQYEQRLVAAQAFARANGIDRRIAGKASGNRLGIVTTGKATLDVIEALRQIGIHDRLEELGIAVYKVAMSWPLEPKGLRAFAEGCEELLLVEEKRPVIEEQLAHILYNLPADRRPRLVGKTDESGAPLLPQVGELAPDTVTRAIRRRLLKFDYDGETRRMLSGVEAVVPQAAVTAAAGGLVRMPSFCAGCPHNTSTRVPEGSIAMGGIGCHGLATWLPERKTVTLYHMGGEGAPWIGQAPFVDREHIFQNLGDGTYFHSGLLAVRACVAADVNITYKILLNGAIAMTGGQPIEGESFDGAITAPHVAAQLVAEGVKRVALVTDELSRHKSGDFPAGISFHHRDDLDAVQREMREVSGVTAIIYDQSCATERRRLRKRGKVADPNERLFINTDVCEGCGDCGVQSNCVALEPVETALGRKRRINQSVCNKDYSCVKGLCPSFVTVEGGTPRKARSQAVEEAFSTEGLPLPALPDIGHAYSIMVAGIGGNGVVTVGAILGMAAHIEGRGVSVLDMSGLAQRNGPVTSHVRLTQGEVGGIAPRIPERAADLVIGCDLVVAAGAEGISKMAADRTAVVYNRFVAPTSSFASNPDLDFSDGKLVDVIARHADPARLNGLDATAAAMAMLGDTIGANMLLVGMAWQLGLIPIRLESLERAIELNGAAVPLNLRAFAMGRIAACHPERVAEWLDQSSKAQAATPVAGLESVVETRARLLTDFQDEALAQRYAALVDRVALAEARVAGKTGPLSLAVANAYANTLYYKDEYEVGRLYSSPRFHEQLGAAFEGDYRIHFNLAPPLFAKRDKDGRPRKMRFGAWMRHGFALLGRMKGLRGTPFDPFGYMHHRRMERALPGEYEALVDRLLAGLSPERVEEAARIAGSYARVKGYDLVKETKLAQVRADVAEAMAAYEAPIAATERTPEPA
ncbi:indolepyruvate ferredoxin oxidoreductase family protein [Sphingobium estronivorans]|uniref:indolepyruvate ferredoxin oxidoreductase family protein n=1 Tax=Sphingobium estronivorans TaxID=1577690 RepID=UPI001238CAEF|nr:indolepyruvate ferredoxin oxidoreductase family protein [Sphingobium estronivorans]